MAYLSIYCLKIYHSMRKFNESIFYNHVALSFTIIFNLSNFNVDMKS